MAHRVDVTNNFHTNYAIDKYTHSLAHYARIWQEANIVSIVELKIFIDEIHDIKTTAVVQKQSV